MPNANIYALFRSRFPTDKNAVFLQHDKGELKYSCVEQETGRYLSLLEKHGVKPGDRIVVQVDKSPEAVLLYLSCLRAGAIFIPLNTAYTPNEVSYFLDDAKPKLFICRKKDENIFHQAVKSQIVSTILTFSPEGTGSLTEALKGLPSSKQVTPRTKDDVAAILYTSGTTGRSKGAMLTHGNLASNALALHKYWEFEPGDILLHTLPIFHVHGLFVALHCALLNGSRVLFHSTFNADKTIEDLPNATVMMGVPTHYTRLLEQEKFNKEICDHMRLFVSGSAPLMTETFKTFEERTGHRILERYGMTEALMITSNPYKGERIAGTVGFALPNIQVRITDNDGKELPIEKTGSLEVKGPNVFKGYWLMPEKTSLEFREGGWFVTGDIATIDVAGRVKIVGREKDLIISGGFNVYPSEIESFIDDIKGIKESAVFGVRHPDFGEAVTAVIVPEDQANFDIEMTHKYLASKLAKFKQPKKMFVLPELPRNSMGKVLKNVLREEYANIYLKRPS